MNDSYKLRLEGYAGHVLDRPHTYIMLKKPLSSMQDQLREQGVFPSKPATNVPEGLYSMAVNEEGQIEMAPCASPSSNRINGMLDLVSKRVKIYENPNANDDERQKMDKFKEYVYGHREANLRPGLKRLEIILKKA